MMNQPGEEVSSHMTPDAMSVYYEDGSSSSVGGIETAICSDCGIRGPAAQMDWYPPNPLSIEWVCRTGFGCQAG
jgi:hypothetical protein